MTTVVFLGPSLPVEEARTILDATYLPPAGQGDLLSAVTTYHPEAIALIDGVFLQSLSTWHKEILYALDRNVAVYGASSMGAIRAAETAEFGMIGIGQVYEMYRTGELTDDDEVALVHGSSDSGFAPLSVPMVNVRATFQFAVDQELIDRETCDSLVAIAKAVYFQERTFPIILHKAIALGLPPKTAESILEFVSNNYQDIKRRDAVLLLQTLRDSRDDISNHHKGFDFKDSYLFQVLYNRDRTIRRNGFDFPLYLIGDYAAVNLKDFSLINFHALNRGLVLIMADLFDVKPQAEDIDDEVKRFRVRWGLHREDELAEWLVNNDLEMSEFRELMRENAACRALHRWLMIRKYMERNTRLILDELRLENRYSEVAESAGISERIISQRLSQFVETSRSEVSLRDLLHDHFSTTNCVIDTDIVTWSEEAGFHSVNDLRIALLKARLVRKLIYEAARAISSFVNGNEAGAEETEP
jgi:hypothetical protein